jgi:hypothetical protein
MRRVGLKPFFYDLGSKLRKKKILHIKKLYSEDERI